MRCDRYVLVLYMKLIRSSWRLGKKYFLNFLTIFNPPKMAPKPIFEMWSICIVIIYEIDTFFMEIMKKIFLELFDHFGPKNGPKIYFLLITLLICLCSAYLSSLLLCYLFCFLAICSSRGSTYSCLFICTWKSTWKSLNSTT